MELSREEARKIFAPLFENQRDLAHDIFDFKNEMRPEITAHIKKCIVLSKELMLSFLKDKVVDTVCYGDICSALYHANTKIHIAFIMETELPDRTLFNISSAVDQRGFIFQIYHHRMHFHIFKKGTPLGANWSITKNCWNVEPKFQNFPYSLDEFLDIYPQINHRFHEALDYLEKDNDGFLTLKSQEIIKKYFSDMEQRAFKARYESIDKEYSLDWSLWRALNLMAVPQHYFDLIKKAETHTFGGDKNGSKRV